MFTFWVVTLRLINTNFLANSRRLQAEKRLNELTPEPRFISIQAIERAMVQVRETLKAMSQISTLVDRMEAKLERGIAGHGRTMVAFRVRIAFALDVRKLRSERRIVDFLPRMPALANDFGVDRQ